MGKASGHIPALSRTRSLTTELAVGKRPAPGPDMTLCAHAHGWAAVSRSPRTPHRTLCSGRKKGGEKKEKKKGEEKGEEEKEEKGEEKRRKKKKGDGLYYKGAPQVRHAPTREARKFFWPFLVTRF